MFNINQFMEKSKRTVASDDSWHNADSLDKFEGGDGDENTIQAKDKDDEFSKLVNENNI